MGAGGSLPRYVAHSSAELVAGERYDAITGEFDRKAVAKALGVDVGAAQAYRSGSCAPATDTEAWMRWAMRQPQPPCAQWQ